MTRFNPSRFSTEAYGDAGGAGASTSYVDLYDVQKTGPFRVYSDGTVKLMSSGKTWSPGSSNYSLLLANLSDVPGNESKIHNVIGTVEAGQAIASGRQAQKSVSSPSSPSSLGPTQPTSNISGTSTPLTQKGWFWPVIIVTSAVGIGGGIYVYRNKETIFKNFAK